MWKQKKITSFDTCAGLEGETSDCSGIDISQTSLDPVMSDLPRDIAQQFLSQQTYLERNQDLSTAAFDAWASIPRALGELMVRCYVMRESNIRITEAHPKPSLSFALSYFNDTATLPLSLKSLATQLLSKATIGKGQARTYAYEDTDGIRDHSDESEWEDIFTKAAEMDALKI